MILMSWLLGHPPVTMADMSSHFGLSPRAIGMGNAGAAVIDDYSATYHNPAALGMNPDSCVSFGYFYTSPRVKIRDPQGVEQLYMKEHMQTGVIGFQQNLKKLITEKWDKNMVVGLAIALPDQYKAATMVETYVYKDPQIPVFGRVPDMMVINAGVGMELHKWLLVGAGIRFSATYDAANITVLLHVPSMDLTTQKLEVNADTEMMPIAGVVIRPSDKLRLAGVWRRGGSPIKLLGKGGGAALIGPFAIPINLGLAYRDFFTPTETSLSLAFSPMDKLMLAYEAVHSKWSKYDVPIGDTPPGDPFMDIWVHRFGAEYLFSDKLSVQAGYYYHPSPIKDVQPDTCYLDTDEHVFSTAAEYVLPLEGIFKYPIKFQAYLQYQHLPKRTFSTLGADTAIWGYIINMGALVQLQWM